MIINLDQLKQILDLARDHELSELEIEQEGMRLRIRRDGLVGHILAAPPLAAAVPALAPPGPSAVAGSSVASEAAVSGDSEIELAVVKSPIVGTFYRSSEPGAPPFVEVGTTVKKGAGTRWAMTAGARITVAIQSARVGLRFAASHSR